MTEDRARDGDWDRTEWEGGGAGPDASTTTGDRWTKTQWVGDQGHGAPPPEDPDVMPEGEPGLSGDRHTPSEQHWARGQSREDAG